MAAGEGGSAHASVSGVPTSGLCCSCGLCEAVCPVGGVGLVERDGSWVPEVRRCVGCGRCLRVCPGAGASWDTGSPIAAQLEGPCLEAASAWSADPGTHRGSVSGGVATQLVSTLLRGGAYDVAYLAGPAVPGRRLDSAPYRAGDDLSGTQGSKYVQVCHSAALARMARHPGERAVVVAVPCVVRGLSSAMGELGLDRDNYLLIGLFCDKTMRYGVLDRLASLGSGGPVSRVDFRSKEPSGWPGDVVLRHPGGLSEALPRERRMEVKELFCPERCLYCLDKLNVTADISLGDDYTGDGANPAGANSVAVRTERGLRAWRLCAGGVASVPSTMERIASSQGLGARLENLAFDRAAADRSGRPPVNRGIDPDDGPGPSESARAELDARLAAAALGGSYADDPTALEAEVRRRRGPLPKRLARAARRLARRLLGRR